MADAHVHLGLEDHSVGAQTKSPNISVSLTENLSGDCQNGPRAGTVCELTSRDVKRRLNGNTKSFDQRAVELSEDVREFCRHHDLLAELKEAITLAEECFESADIRVEKDVDPETGENWLLMTITVSEVPMTVGKAHGKYLERWVSAVPWPKRSLVRISYDFV
jgi:hypothetical protein